MPDKPSLQRRQLGMELRRLREEAGRSRDDAAATIDRTISMVSRIENGLTGIRLSDLERLLKLYRVTGEQRAQVLALGEAARHRKRTATTYVDSAPNWFRRYAALEREASEVRCVEAELVPGLLQSEGYAEAIMATARAFAGAEEVERRVQTRLARQQLLTREDPPAPLFWFVINEAVLRRAVGGPDVMREQLKHLLGAAELPNVDLRVLPFAAGEHAAVGFSFWILRFGDDPSADVVYSDSLSGALYPERGADIEWHNVVFGQLLVIAASPEESRRMITKAAREFR
ncbi:transcriptional regulator [Longimycelium tulufanense]|uniref:Transcriptional regulator n=1 Tax=Longimycelium tulufanense TaxID=907463 RepID=A0A8J3FUT0_9PSEU|nr:helix-turn-helix transcriptional regulator [Longimycelium tulufanense]GGM52645.1 transcriptional regulator [Longimycelium tulufanense]